jgi:Flp pilus assembly protein TadG
VITAIVQFGIAYNHYVELTNAVRAGARVAAVSASAANPAQATCDEMQASAPALFDAGSCGQTIQVSPSPGWTSGGDVTVTGSSDYKLAIFGMNVIDVPMSSTTTERIE